MTVQEAVRELTYQERIAILHDLKLRDTRAKQEIIGSMDHDDWAQVLPPADRRLVIEAISGSGEKITDVLLDGVEIETNYPGGAQLSPPARCPSALCRSCGLDRRRVHGQL